MEYRASACHATTAVPPSCTLLLVSVPGPKVKSKKICSHISAQNSLTLQMRMLRLQMRMSRLTYDMEHRFPYNN